MNQIMTAGVIQVQLVINFAQDNFECDFLPILDADGHMTSCTKNNLQKELNYDCRAYPSAVGHVTNFAKDCFENDVLPILDADGRMTNCTKNSFRKKIKLTMTTGPI